MRDRTNHERRQPPDLARRRRQKPERTRPKKPVARFAVEVWRAAREAGGGDCIPRVSGYSPRLIVEGWVPIIELSCGARRLLAIENALCSGPLVASEFAQRAGRER